MLPRWRFCDAAPEIEAVLALHCPTAVATSTETAQAVIAAAPSKKPLLTAWLGGADAREARALFAGARIPTFETPASAVTGFSYLVRHRRGQLALMEVPPAHSPTFTARTGDARAIVARALAAGGGWMERDAMWALFDCYGVPHMRSASVTTEAEAVACAKTFGGPVALKIVSPDIVHKSDVGGVMLDVAPDAVVAAAKEMTRRVREKAPNANLTGFTLEEMVRRPAAVELIAGMAADRQFGPFLLFGQGGTAVEVVADKAIALPPLNAVLARRMIGETRVARLLRGYRDRPAADMNAIVSVLLQLSQMVCDLDEIAELDINPLLADGAGAIALDARIRLQAAPGAEPHARLAIRPYPAELAHAASLPKVGAVSIRPIRPEDAAAVEAFFERLKSEDVRLRFFVPLHDLEPRRLARLTQIDYDREMALVALSQDTGDLLGIARMAADPDNIRAEFAVTVRSDLKRRGLGRLLLADLIGYARARGLRELFGEVLRENEAMLALARSLGFAQEAGEGADTVRLRLALS